MGIDFHGINQDVASRSDTFFSDNLSGGKLGGNGKYYSVKDPVTNEAHESLIVWTAEGNFKNYTTGASGGDFIALYAYLNNLSEMSESANQLSEWCGNKTKTPNTDKADKPKSKGRKAIHNVPPPTVFINDKIRFCEPSKVWIYTDKCGGEALRVYRVDLSNGDKTFRQLRKVASGWKWEGKPENCPLYNLEQITNMVPGKRVVICEGEKATDAANILLSKTHVATTTIQGAMSPKKTDFSPLKGLDVDLWRDNDVPGEKYVQIVATLALNAGANSVRFLKIPSNWEVKWDAADILDNSLSVDDFEWEPFSLPVPKCVEREDDPDNHFLLPVELDKFSFVDGKLHYKRETKTGERLDLIYNGFIDVAEARTDVDTDKCLLLVSFSTPNGAKKAFIPLEEVAQKRGILKYLTSTGALVPETRAHYISEFLIDLYGFKQNLKHVEETKLLGVVNNGLALPGVSVKTDVLYSGNLLPNPDKGSEIYFDTIREIFKWGADSWPLVNMLGWSLSAPFLERLDFKRNPCLAITGSSGFGKSTVCKFVLAAWGNAEKLPFKVEGAKSNTQVGIDQNISRMRGLPWCIDEIHKMPSTPHGREISWGPLLYSHGNGQQRIRGSINENQPLGGNRTYSILFGAGESVPMMTDKGAYNRLVIINIDTHPPFGIPGVDSDGGQSKDGLTRANMLTEAQSAGWGIAGAKVYAYIMENWDAFQAMYHQKLNSEQIISLQHHRQIFALSQTVLEYLCQMLGIKQIPNSILVIPEHMKQIIMDMSYGGEHDPDIEAFNKLKDMLSASEQAVDGGISKPYFKLGGEIVAFKSPIKEVNGKQCMCVNPNTNAFKRYVGANGIKQYGTAWIKHGLIIPMLDGRRPLSTRSFVTPAGLKVRCIALPIDVDTDTEQQSERMTIDD